ncbi:MAG: alkyl/aryl-sulfatase [Acidimicrobiia bacterium]|nr:alkyl/aryl-sulfatase [Acidimicrobiia bacterium]MYC44151.1 alkyl/aryl-sulfatase [Acidimicrobiia bacterium]MYI20699.1 alkyl/aryl-sulfatase [Acidimicrobiia bacterium]
MGEPETEATHALRVRQASLRQDFVKLTDRVFVATGYGMSTFAFIVGDTGVLAVDAGSDPGPTAQALAELRRHSDLPLLGVVYTHGHIDHTHGAMAFVEDNPDLQIWAIKPFGTEGRWLARNEARIAALRSAWHFGSFLPPETFTNVGTPDPDSARKAGLGAAPDPRIRPRRRFVGSATIRLGGVELEVSHNPGETDDQIMAWFAPERVAFAADNLYPSWPNLYAIRGTRYRDVRAWCESVDRIRALQADHLVMGHGSPISGAETVDEILAVYSRALWHVYNATIEGMNAGRTPDELAHEVTLPEDLAGHWMLREFYGTVAWSVRSIFAGLLGPFDGNPTSLDPLHPADRSRRIAELCGGPEVLLTEARGALAAGEAQWAAELCDMLLALDFRRSDVAALKADALDEIARHLLTSAGRNYLHTGAQELRRSVEQVTAG